MAKHTVLEVGDVVTIFEDPHTKQKPEGKAVLKKQLIDDCRNYKGADKGSGYWKVKFANGDVVDRWVYTD